MKSIILKGGLGNQLFQLAAFFSLSKKENFKDLMLDCKSGFILDFKYKRKLEINSIKKSKFSCPNKIVFINVLILILKRYLPFLLKKFSVEFLDDKNINQFDSLEKNYSDKYLLINGYFQNSNLVKNSINEVYEITNKFFELEQSNNFNELIIDINQTESIALCIRFYEESKNPKLHCNSFIGKKSVEEFNSVIRIIEEKLDNPVFYIFVQFQNEFTKKLNFKSPFKFITHEKGYVGSWPRLKAQSYCKHHIFNNSTFYYWGAKFSEIRYLNSNTNYLKFVSNNFIFKEIYPDNWNIF